MKIAICMLLLSAAFSAGAAPSEDFALKSAARSGDLVAVQRLLAGGAAVDEVDTGGNTALISAAYHDHPELLTTLLQSGAEAMHRNADGYSALDYAMENGHRDVVRALLGYWRGRASQDPGQSAALDVLIAVTDATTAPALPDSFDPNGANASGYTALAMAARWGCEAAVDALLTKGAKVDAATDSRYRSSALMEATRDGRLEIAKKLLAAGADVNLRDRHGDHALNWAAYFGQAELVELFVAHGADLSYTGQTPENALQIAKREGHTRVVEILERAAARAN